MQTVSDLNLFNHLLKTNTTTCGEERKCKHNTYTYVSHIHITQELNNLQKQPGGREL